MATPLNQSIRSRSCSVGTRRTHAILPRNKNFLRQFILQYINNEMFLIDTQLDVN